MRKIPATMVTQHPDHASTPYWHDKPFITTKHESHEMYLSFKELGATEYKWDWEGKLVDEAVMERIMSNYYDYFKKHQIGKDFFLTFRLPNPKVETEFRLGRAYMSILAASGLTKYLGMHSQPLFEVILPMTTSAEEMIAVQEAFKELTSLKHPLLKLDSGLKHIELIPLFEDIDTIANSDRILKQYIDMHQKLFGFKPEYMRPYVARSDPALNAGIVPTVLAIKIALSHYDRLSEETGIPMYPVIGAAALPFRGGLRPTDVHTFINEYKGIRTTTIQSAFRYDFPKKDVIAAIATLEKELKLHKAQLISVKEQKELLKVMSIFEKEYKKTIEQIAPLINEVAKQIPKRRERVQHVGLFGYSRGVGSVQLPRAIGFTAALYSLGIPPEIIGTGRGIATLMRDDRHDMLSAYYKNIHSDLTETLKYTNIPLIEELAKTIPGLDGILKDIDGIVKYLGGLPTPSDHHKEHRTLSQKLVNRLKAEKSFTNLIEESGILRKSLG
jgi:phosphoenolpyruvate carboxylase